MNQTRIVSRDRWIAERKKLLAREKELTHLRDQVARERRALPWVRIGKDYVFDTPEGRRQARERVHGRFVAPNVRVEQCACRRSSA